jgi:hypothetical protein
VGGGGKFRVMNEAMIIGALMYRAMEWTAAEVAIPNITQIYRWEADLIAVTKAWYTHEYEVKISLADFKADRKKRRKHAELAGVYKRGQGVRTTTPNYFWYVTNGFDLDCEQIPPYAGWLRVTNDSSVIRFELKKDAPLLHKEKLSDKARSRLARWLSYKLKNAYRKEHLKGYSIPRYD